eukprot:gene8723-10721_t
MGRESRCQRHVENRRMRLSQQLARPLQPQAHVVAPRRHVEMAQKQALHLPDGQADSLGQPHRRFRLFEIVGHQLDDLAQLLGFSGQVPLGPDALAIGLRADALMVELVGHFIGKAGIEILPDDLQHQIDRGRPARAGIALAVDLENIAGAFDLRKTLLKTGAVFPMDRAAMPFELACFGEDVTADVEPAQRRTAPSQIAQRCDNLGFFLKFGGQPGADEENIGGGKLRQRILHIDLQTVRCGDWRTRGGHGGPPVEWLFRHTVGRAHCIDGSGKAEHREFVDKQKSEGSTDLEGFGHMLF